MAAMPVGQSLDDFIQQQERGYIEATLSHCGGSREKAASVLEYQYGHALSQGRIEEQEIGR